MEGASSLANVTNKANMEGSSGVTTDRSERYMRAPGFITSAGLIYEINLMALLFLRAKAQRVPFQLFSNPTGAQKFDDIVFKYQTLDSRWHTCFFQVRYTTSGRKKITMEKLLEPIGSYSLQQFYGSFREIMSDMAKSNDGIFLGNIEDCSFVVFTNSKHKISEIEKRHSMTLFNDYLKTDETKAEVFGINYFPAFRTTYAVEFLNQFTLCTGMPGVDELNEDISSEIMKLGHLVDFDDIKRMFVTNMSNWYNSSGSLVPILNENSDIFESAVNQVTYTIEPSQKPEYSKTTLLFDAHNQLYHLKLLALLFLKAKRKQIFFKLFINTHTQLKFDIGFKYKKSTGYWHTSFIELLHKTPEYIVKFQTLAQRLSWSVLLKFYNSFCKVREEVQRQNEKSVSHLRDDLKDFTLVAFTNALFNVPESRKVEEYEETFFSTFLNFKNETANVFGLKKETFLTTTEMDWPMREEFLDQFVICSGMPNSDHLDQYLDQEIKEAGHPGNINKIRLEILRVFEEWCEQCVEGDTLSETSDIIDKAIHRANQQGCRELYIDIQFTVDYLNHLTESLLPRLSCFLHILYSDNTPRVVFNKLLQIFRVEGTLYTFISLSDSQRHYRLSEWKKRKNNRVLLLVANADHNIGQQRTFFEDILVILEAEQEGKRSGSKKKTVLLMSQEKYFDFTELVEEIFGEMYKLIVERFYFD